MRSCVIAERLVQRGAHHPAPAILGYRASPGTGTPRPFGGIGSALIEFGLEQARESGTGMVLETGTQRNVPLYQRLGFHVVEEADSPKGGPHVWFMRRDPYLAHE
jgi:hypothetical protein